MSIDEVCGARLDDRGLVHSARNTAQSDSSLGAYWEGLLVTLAQNLALRSRFWPERLAFLAHARLAKNFLELGNSATWQEVYVMHHSR